MYKKKAFLGIDIGTTSAKTGLISTKGELLGFSSSKYVIFNPSSFNYEQNPMDWWKAVKQNIKCLQEQTDFRTIEILSIGVCGQTPTLVFVDKNGEIARPAIIWKDSRAQQEALYLKEKIGEKLMADFIGTQIPLEASWIPAKLLWLKKNDPESLKKTFKIIQPKDFINYKLSNRLASDYWCSKGLINVKTMKPSEEFYKTLEINSDIAPEAFSPSNLIGGISEEASRSLGLTKGIPIVAGWADSLCGMLGVGVFARPGQAFNISGTSEIVGLSVESIGDLPQGLMSISVEGFQSVIFGPTQSGGGTLDWFIDSFINNKKISLDEKYDLIEKIQTSVVLDKSSIVFLPFIEGERAPIWDQKARGLFFGLKKSDGFGDFAHSVMSGVAFNIRSIFELIEEVYGKEISEFSLSGGTSRIDVWNKIKCDVIGKKIKIFENIESSVLGAAMLGALGVGYFNNVADMSREMVRGRMVIKPNIDRHIIYDGLFEKYKRLYSLTKNEF